MNSGTPATISINTPSKLASSLPRTNSEFDRFVSSSNSKVRRSFSCATALAEAGDPTFDAAYCGTAYGGVASGHKVLGALARTGMPIVDVEAGCASGGAALQLAAGAIRAMLALSGRNDVEVHCAAQTEISVRFRIGETTGRAFQPTFDNIFFQTKAIAV